MMKTISCVSGAITLNLVFPIHHADKRKVGQGFDICYYVRLIKITTLEMLYEIKTLRFCIFKMITITVLWYRIMTLTILIYAKNDTHSISNPLWQHAVLNTFQNKYDTRNFLILKLWHSQFRDLKLRHSYSWCPRVMRSLVPRCES